MRTIAIFIIIFTFTMTGASAFNGAPLDTVRSAPLVMAKPAAQYTYGLDEIVRAADLYKAVEEASAFKAVADKYAMVSENKAIANYLMALTKMKRFRISKEYGDLSFRLASLYYNQKKYDEAARFFKRATVSFDSLKMDQAAGKSYIRLATVKLQQKNYKEAEALILKKGLPLCAPSDNLSCYQVLATTYQEQNRYSEAKWFHLQANTSARRTNDTRSIIVSLTALAKIKTALKDYSLAIKDLNEAETLAAEPGFESNLDEIKQALKVLETRAPKLMATRAATIARAKAVPEIHAVSSVGATSVSLQAYADK